MSSLRVLSVLAVAALGACTTEWNETPQQFVHAGQTWNMLKVRLELTGTWQDAPPEITEAEIRYHAIRAFEAYASCKATPSSTEIIPGGAIAQMTC